MRHDVLTGRVAPSEFIQSNNFNCRSYGVTIDSIIIHCISLPPNEFNSAVDYVSQLFTNSLDASTHPYFEQISTLRVSSHFYIRRNGKLMQYVATQYRAWHAGESSLHGRPMVNDFSIGIELEGCETQGYEAAQYTRLAQLSNCLQQSYPNICQHNIAAHSDIAPCRKTDPGPLFDWQKYFSLLAFE